MTIDIERLIDAALEEMGNEKEFRYLMVNKYKLYPDYEDRKRKCSYISKTLTESRYVIYGIVDVLQLNKKYDELYIAARAVQKWREMTHYERLIPQSMKDQIGKYLFGDEYETEDERMHKKMLKDWGYI